MNRSRLMCLLCFVLAGSVSAADDETRKQTDGETQKVSYHGQIRTILQARCQGCHQPAKSGGGYVMTNFSKLVAGGESETAAIVPGKPADSYLMELITPQDGKAEMPKGKPPLKPAELDLIRRWIAEGATDDTPVSAHQKFDKDHPPIYTRPPVVTSRLPGSTAVNSKPTSGSTSQVSVPIVKRTVSRGVFVSAWLLYLRRIVPRPGLQEPDDRDTIVLCDYIRR